MGNIQTQKGLFMLIPCNAGARDLLDGFLCLSHITLL